MTKIFIESGYVPFHNKHFPGKEIIYKFLCLVLPALLILTLGVVTKGMLKCTSENPQLPRAFSGKYSQDKFMPQKHPLSQENGNMHCIRPLIPFHKPIMRIHIRIIWSYNRNMSNKHFFDVQLSA